MTMSVCLVVHGYNIYIYWRKSDSSATRTSKEYKRSAKITRLLNEKREQTVNSELWRHIYILGMWRSIFWVSVGDGQVKQVPWRKWSCTMKPCMHVVGEPTAGLVHTHSILPPPHCWVGLHSQNYTLIMADVNAYPPPPQQPHSCNPPRRSREQRRVNEWSDEMDKMSWMGPRRPYLHSKDIYVYAYIQAALHFLVLLNDKLGLLPDWCLSRV